MVECFFGMSDFDRDLLASLTPHLLWMAGAWGALWGSFANVVIARWPREMSVVRPGSHCFSCGAPIRFYDNIPILSYFILRGRCRSCRAAYSARYMLIEALLGLLAAAVMYRTLSAPWEGLAQGLTQFFFGFSLCFALVTAAMIDLDTYLLPDHITLPGIAVGLIVNLAVLRNEGPWWDPLAAALGSYLVLHLVFVRGYTWLTGRQGMGEGDPRLLAMIGACVGIEGALFALVSGATQGLIVGLFMVLVRRRNKQEAQRPPEESLGDNSEEAPFDPDAHSALLHAAVPFGPFLALGAVEYYFGGKGVIAYVVEWLVARLLS